MGTVFKSKITRPMPGCATLVVRDGREWAEWRGAAGKLRRAPTTGARATRPGIIVEATTFTAKFRDGKGVVRKIATGCRTREAAKRVLADLESRAEKVRSGILSSRESDAAEYLHAPVEEQIEAYVTALAKSRGKGAHAQVSATHVANVRQSLSQLAQACRFRTLRDLDRQAVQRWAGDSLKTANDSLGVSGSSRRPPGPRTINSKLTALTAFGNWLVSEGRLLENPFDRLEKLDESDDVRRKRRSLTVEEFGRLLEVARWRPLAEYGRETVRVVEKKPTRSRATWKKSPLTAETMAAAAFRGREAVQTDVADRLDIAGWERALIYETLLTTGLRKGELASLTIGDVNLSGEAPSVVLRGVHAKNGRRSTLPLRVDVAGHLRDWVADRRRRAMATDAGLPPEAPLFHVPSSLIRILDRDLAAAGIPKVDERGHRIDVHALRTTFNTQLAVAKVDPRTAMAAMRVSSLDLVLKTYADEKLIDVARAVGALPAPPTPSPKLAVGSSLASEVAGSVVPIVVPAPGIGSPRRGTGGLEEKTRITKTRDEKPQKERGSVVFSQIPEERAKGLEPSTSSLGS